MPLRAAESPPDLLIVEVMPGTITDAGREFVEIFNPGSQKIDLANYTLQKHAASGNLDSGWQDYALFPSEPGELAIESEARLLVATSSYPKADWPVKNVNGALAATGGYLRLVHQGKDIEEIDRMQWSGDLLQSCAEGDVLEATPSFKRKLTAEREFVFGTGQDFCRSVQETPGEDDEKLTLKPPKEEDPEDEGPTTPGQGGDPESETPTEEPHKTYPAVEITELLPDPVSPFTDAADEFIELYNPNGMAVDLSGYVLEAGKDFTDRYVIKEGVIGAGQYLALRSALTDIGLSNSGGAARLLNPNEDVISVTGTYPEAKSGYSWVNSDNLWQWSATPTPGTANTVTAAPLKPIALKASAPKKAAAPKAVKASAVKAPSASKNPKNETKSSTATEPAAITPDKPNYGILLVVVAAVAAYALFEYRHDIRNKFRQLKDNLGNRFGNRSGA